MRKVWMVCWMLLIGCPLHAEEKPYVISVRVDPSIVKVNEKAVVRYTIAPKNNLVFKGDTPFKATLKGTVKFDKDVLTNQDFLPLKNGVQVGFLAPRAGRQEIVADLSFFLCTAELCQRYKDTANIEFTSK
jgi:hypothetical protein